jgi:hypothetical protein
MELIEDTYCGNSDGFGLMWYADGRVQTFKAADIKPSEILEVVSRVQHCERVLHFRMATHGSIDDANTHPFEVVPGMFMMHNGILPFNAPRGSGKSDTAVFNEQVVRPLVEVGGFDALDNPGVIELIDHVLDGSNRLAFMDDTGRVRIFGRDIGIEWKGLWCSNTYAWSLHRPANWGVHGGGLLTHGTSYSRRVTPVRRDWIDEDDDDTLYDMWLQQSQQPGETLAKLTVVDDKPEQGLRLVDKPSPNWETTEGNVISDEVAEVLMMTDDELYEACRLDPDQIVDFISAVRDYIGEPVDTIDYAG